MNKESGRFTEVKILIYDSLGNEVKPSQMIAGIDYMCKADVSPFREVENS